MKTLVFRQTTPVHKTQIDFPLQKRKTQFKCSSSLGTVAIKVFSLSQQKNFIYTNYRKNLGTLHSYLLGGLTQGMFEAGGDPEVSVS